MAEERKVCEGCGKEVDAFAYGHYCKDCAQEVWDSGFEGTSEHAYDIGFHGLVDCLSEGGEEARTAAEEIISQWGDLTWACGGCGRIVLAVEVAEKLNRAEKVATVTTACSCGGTPVPEPPDRYFR